MKAASGWIVRPARAGDVGALLELAHLTGGGFTNLPADGPALERRVERSLAALARIDESADDELYILVLEEPSTGRIGGTASLISRVGVEWPFYSYKLSTLHKTSRELKRSFATRVLSLVNDYDGASEVCGLFLHPGLHGTGLGKLLARSRYLFMAQARSRFAERTIAELRGRMCADGHSPFWDALAGRFFGMDFREADRFNAIYGNQFIVDLMPKLPVYVDLLPADAQATIGQPHDAGRAALRMLEAEGFAFDGYVDIFDGGPTVAAKTDDIRTIRDSRVSPACEAAGETLAPTLLAAGRLAEFRAWVAPAADGARGLAMPADALALADVEQGEMVRHAG